ncbi:FecR domain-containing protein [Bacteroides sp. OttesenSCG-928-M17]|nr:FecR domain-containing protein [Bacteroides sp. OttesenSCG-928-M17]
MKEEKHNELNEDIMVKFLTGDCSEEELRGVNAWLEESSENARELFKAEQIYHLGRRNEAVDEKKTNQAEEALFKRIKSEEENKRKLRGMNRWVRYAALLAGIIVLVGVGRYAYREYEEVSSLVVVAAHDEVKELMLPDGTKVWLNKHATLKYPRRFSEKGRNVQMEGEAYFEVFRDPHNSFVVKSEVVQVRVLGTTFNLKSDRVNHSAVATLLKGEIEVKGNNDEGMIVLSPGQKAELNGVTRRLVVKQVDTGIEKWHTNEFDFDKADIFTVARTLENSYNVKIILSPAMDSSKTYSGPLKKKETLEEMLKQVQNSIPIEYKIVGNSVFLSPKK